MRKSQVKTAFVIVSQSETLARGVCEVVSTMAPDVIMAACGCHDEGLGTASQLIKQTIAALMDQLEADCAIVLLADLGASRLAAQQVVSDLNNRQIVLGKGPLVEGSAAGVVAAQQGEGLPSVLRSISSAAQFFPTVQSSPEVEKPALLDPLAPRRVVLADPQGLGPKPAAFFARRAFEFEAEVKVNGVEATSVLALMGLGLKMGDQIVLSATGAEAEIALEQLSKYLASRKVDDLSPSSLENLENPPVSTEPIQPSSDLEDNLDPQVSLAEIEGIDELDDEEIVRRLKNASFGQ